MTTTELEVKKDEESRRIVCAVELGWRMSYFYADLEHPLHPADDPGAAPACLPAVETLANADQLEVHARAAASIAGRLDLKARAEIERLARDAHAATKRADPDAGLRARVHDLHHRLMKELWANREGEGKAYQLGSSLFDTWDRMRRAADDDRLAEAWVPVFDEKRVERIKELLDDLQTRLDPTAVEVVKDQLDRWGKLVREAGGPRGKGLPTGDKALEEIRRQALIWRQLVTRDKEPEAYLDRKQRARVRREFNRLMWTSLLRPRTLVVVAVLAALVWVLRSQDVDPDQMRKVGIALLGVLGVTQASLIVLARDRLNHWSTLLWNRALTIVVFQVTCRADPVFVPPRRFAPALRAAKCTSWPRKAMRFGQRAAAGSAPT
jgi:hypothetical protein